MQIFEVLFSIKVNTRGEKIYICKVKTQGSEWQCRNDTVSVGKWNYIKTGFNSLTCLKEANS